MAGSNSTAGGRATEAGMSFQAMVGTWLAAQLVTDMPVGARFGLRADLRPVELQFETGDALDDAVLRLADRSISNARPGLLWSEGQTRRWRRRLCSSSGSPQSKDQKIPP
jgi:hypothetical protein